MIRKPGISSITLPLLLILPLILLLVGSTSTMAQQLPLPPASQPAPQRESAPKEGREPERRARSGERSSPHPDEPLAGGDSQNAHKRRRRLVAHTGIEPVFQP